MKSVLRYSFFCVAVFAAGSALADVILFSTENFGGRQVTLDRPAPNIGRQGFSDRAQSAIVDGRGWEICADNNFGGGCTVLAPGRYPSLGAWSGRISSARPVSGGPAVSLPSGAGITLYEGPNFSGRRLAVDRMTPSFDPLGFNDRAQSAIVDSPSWEVCNDANFGGNCAVLAPGRYPTLGGLSDRISSARPVTAPVIPLPPVVVAPSPGGAVTFYETEEFGGRQFTIDQPIANFLASRFNDRARSAIVNDSAWEICVDADFRGDCRLFVPGRYPNLGGFAGRVSSARPADEPRGEPRDRPRRAASATLFSGPNFTGRRFRIDSDGTSNLDGLFNDRASSLRIERGYWIFCSDASFRGECRTFGPGEYATLPPELESRISSGRRISNDYPYNQNPSWRQ